MASGSYDEEYPNLRDRDLHIDHCRQVIGRMNRMRRWRSLRHRMILRLLRRFLMNRVILRGDVRIGRRLLMILRLRWSGMKRWLNLRRRNLELNIEDLGNIMKRFAHDTIHEHCRRMKRQRGV